MEFEGYLRFFLALVFVLALIGVLTALARRYGLGYRATPRKGKGRRLSIVEAIPIDAKRRLVLLQRDTTEHLVLLGGGSDLLIESVSAPPSEGSFTRALERISTDENP